MLDMYVNCIMLVATFGHAAQQPYKTIKMSFKTELNISRLFTNGYM